MSTYNLTNLALTPIPTPTAFTTITIAGRRDPEEVSDNSQRGGGDGASAVAVPTALDYGARVDSHHSQTSETFDNPIYDQPTPSRRKRKASSSSAARRNRSSSRSLSGSSSSQEYYPRSVLESSVARSDRKFEDTTDLLSGSEECLNAVFKASNGSTGSPSPRGSVKRPGVLAWGDGGVDKLTVINETYDSLPCHAPGRRTTGGFLHPAFQSPSLTSTPSPVANDGSPQRSARRYHRPVAGAPSLSEAVWGREEVAGGHDQGPGPGRGFHANSLRLEMEP